MKAIVRTEYGSPDVLKLREIEKPVPADDDDLVRVHASSVNIAEWYAMRGIFIGRMGQGLLRPGGTWERVTLREKSLSPWTTRKSLPLSRWERVG